MKQSDDESQISCPFYVLGLKTSDGIMFNILHPHDMLVCLFVCLNPAPGLKPSSHADPGRLEFSLPPEEFSCVQPQV